MKVLATVHTVIDRVDQIVVECDNFSQGEHGAWLNGIHGWVLPDRKDVEVIHVRILPEGTDINNVPFTSYWQEKDREDKIEKEKADIAAWMNKGKQLGSEYWSLVGNH